MVKHARMSPSGAHRWMACPGSVKAEEGRTNTTSVYAEEGTKAHEVADAMLVGGVVPPKFLVDESYDAEMTEHAITYTEFISKMDGELIDTEVKVSIADYVPGCYGYADAIKISDSGVCSVIDYKYGMGEKVDVEDNPQLMLYALGAMAEYDFLHNIHDFDLAIVQPRINNNVRWTITAVDLANWGENVVKPAVALALTEDAPRIPGESQCRWCLAKDDCPALAAQCLDVAADGFTDTGTDLVAGGGMSIERMSFLYSQKKLVDTWFSAIAARLYSELEAGRDVPDFELVEGVSQRKWSSEDGALKALSRRFGKAASCTTKVIGIPAAEKLYDKVVERDRFLAKYVTKPPGKATLALKGGNRTPINVNPAEGFTDTSLDNFLEM